MFLERFLISADLTDFFLSIWLLVCGFTGLRFMLLRALPTELLLQHVHLFAKFLIVFCSPGPKGFGRVRAQCTHVRMHESEIIIGRQFMICRILVRNVLINVTHFQISHSSEHTKIIPCVIICHYFLCPPFQRQSKRTDPSSAGNPSVTHTCLYTRITVNLGNVQVGNNTSVHS
jgi:hypothetical protein